MSIGLLPLITKQEKQSKNSINRKYFNGIAYKFIHAYNSKSNIRYNIINSIETKYVKNCGIYLI